MKLRHAWTLTVVLVGLVSLSGCASQKSRTTLPAPAEFSSAERPSSEDYTIRGAEPTWINPFRSATRWIWKPHFGSQAVAGTVPVDGSVAMAQLVEQRGETDKAIAMYRAILVRTPHDSLVLHRLGVLYAKKEKFQVSRAFLEKAVKFEPHNSVILGDLGYAYYRCRRLSDAERILRQSLGRDPDDATARNNLALVLCVQGRTEEALAEFKEIGSDAEAHASLGFVLSQNSQNKLAAQHFRTAISLDPSLQSTIGVLAKEKEAVERENAASEATAQTAIAAEEKATQKNVKTKNTSGADVASSPAESKHEPARSLPQPTRSVSAKGSPALAGRVRRPPPDPAPIPPAFSPVESLPATGAAPADSVAEAQPITPDDEASFSLSPTELVPLKTMPAARKPITTKPIISEPIVQREPEPTRISELPRVEVGPPTRLPAPPQTVAQKQVKAEAQPQIVWNNTYERSESTEPDKQVTAKPAAKMAQPQTPQVVAPLSPVQVSPRQDIAEQPTPVPTPEAPTTAPLTKVAAEPVESKPATSQPNVMPSLPPQKELVQETLAPLRASPRRLAQQQTLEIDAEEPQMAQLAPITQPPKNDDIRIEVAKEQAAVVSPSDAAWQPSARTAAKSTSPPPFFNPNKREPKTEKPESPKPVLVDLAPEKLPPVCLPEKLAPLQLTPKKLTRQLQEPRLVDTDVNDTNKPIEMADVVTPDGAGWKPARRDTAQKETPPPFFNLRPIESAEEEKKASSDSGATSKVATKVDKGTESGPEPSASVSRAKTQIVEAAPSLSPELEDAKPAELKIQPETLAPIVTAKSLKAKRENRTAQPPQHAESATTVAPPRTEVVESNTTKRPESWLTAYEALVQEAEAVKLQAGEEKRKQQEQADEEPQTLAPIVLARQTSKPLAPKAAKEEPKAPQKLEPISLAPSELQNSANIAEPAPAALAPIKSAKASGLKRPPAKTYQRSLRSEGQE
jgi:Tfp pilus assembly protein PilF